jgi:hypothetical protein
MWRGSSKPLVIVLTSAAIALAAFYIIHRLVDPLPPKTEPAVTFNHLRFPIAPVASCRDRLRQQASRRVGFTILPGLNRHSESIRACS